MIDDWLFMHLCESYIPPTTFENNDHLSFDRLFVSKDQYHVGRVLLGLFRNRNTQNRPVFVFFWELFRFWNKRNIIPFILPNECGLLAIDRICVLLGYFWREILRGRLRRSRLADVVVLRSPPPWVFRFQIKERSFRN